jgi:hypothetical protein
MERIDVGEFLSGIILLGRRKEFFRSRNVGECGQICGFRECSNALRMRANKSGALANAEI